MEKPVMIIDTDPLCLSALSILVLSLGYRPLAFSSGHEACTVLGSLNTAPAALITEYELTLNCEARCMIDRARQRFGRLPIIVLTADTSSRARTALAELDCRVLFKPTNADEIIATLQAYADRPERIGNSSEPAVS